MPLLPASDYAKERQHAGDAEHDESCCPTEGRGHEVAYERHIRGHLRAESAGTKGIVREIVGGALQQPTLQQRQNTEHRDADHGGTANPPPRHELVNDDCQGQQCSDSPDAVCSPPQDAWNDTVDERDVALVVSVGSTLGQPDAEIKEEEKRQVRQDVVLEPGEVRVESEHCDYGECRNEPEPSRYQRGNECERRDERDNHHALHCHEINTAYCVNGCKQEGQAW